MSQNLDRRIDDVLPDECCARCKFWLPIEGLPVRSLGGCRAKSPALQWRYRVKSENGRMERLYDSNWPLTDAEDWCGDYAGHARNGSLIKIDPEGE